LTALAIFARPAAGVGEIAATFGRAAAERSARASNGLPLGGLMAAFFGAASGWLGKLPPVFTTVSGARAVCTASIMAIVAQAVAVANPAP